MRLIDADRADIFSIPTHHRTDTTIWDVKKWLEDQPTIEAEPVKHGRWINEVDLKPELYGWVPLNSVICSVCGKSNSIEKPYCPNCGAKMDLKEETP